MGLSLLMSIFLGIVQGLAEFLPISSSGHLSVIQNLLKLDYNEGEHLFFDVLLHMGTLISVLIVYREEISSMLKDVTDYITGKGEEGKTPDGRFTPALRTFFMIIIATLPLIVILPFYDKIESLYYNTAFIGFALIITGSLLFVSDKLSEGRKNAKTASTADVLIIGLAQAIATLPGLSRSGTTITVGISRGLRRDFAVKFSFLMSIPAVLGSFLISMVKALKAGVDWSLLPTYFVGMVAAAVCGYFAIRLVKYLVSKTKFGKFSYYCWAVGCLTIILSIIL